MRTFLLLALTFLAVNATQPDLRELLLDNIIEVVTYVLGRTDEGLNQLVKDVIPSYTCSDDDICQAGRVMKGVHLKNDRHNLTRRNLNSYANITGHKHCTITASEECPVKDFLEKVKACCQLLRYKSKWHPKKFK